jgi:hypothetical protein
MDYYLILALAVCAGALSLWCPCGYSIAETVTHTVSGWRRFRVRLLLLFSTTFSATVFGFFAGLFVMIFNPGKIPAAVIGIAAVLALIADEIGKRWRRLKPLAVGRQVPREWGIIFSPEAVSVLYGLRLGIAPLTIVASWLWWVAIVCASFYGPWLSALVGATFGASRILISELSTSRTDAESMACRMENVQKIERSLRIAAVIAALASVVALTVHDSSSPSQNASKSTPSARSNTTYQAPLEAPYSTLAAILPQKLDGYRINTHAKAIGSLDLNAAVNAERDKSAERALLETRHFKNGYARAFTNDKTDVYMVVYDFADHNGASLYLKDGFITLYGKGARIYDIDDVPGARGFSESTEADGRPAVVHGVAFSKLDRFVLVFTRSASTSSPAEAEQLASSIYSRV